MNQERIARIKALRDEISSLPKGYISTKTIRGSLYYYHQWSENGKKMSKYLSEEELIELNKLIKKRQELEQELKALKRGYESSFVLMHKNIAVIDLYFDNEGYIKSIGSVYSIEHLPLGSVNEKGNIDSNGLSSWWNDRSIPLSRSGIKEVIEKLNINNPQTLLIKCLGLSLSDQYWIKPKDRDIKWEDVNFFDNDFSEDVGKLLFGKPITNKDMNLSSPDNTSVGNLKKRWKIINGKRMMIKGGSNPFRQEPYNEVIASKIGEVLDLDCIKYHLVEIDGYPYSECEDFVNKDEDLIPADQIRKTLKKNNSESNYFHLLRCAETLNIKGFKEYLDRLLVFDFIIANEDRHFNNFGVIRNATTLDFISPSPIFDSGASFGFNKIKDDIHAFDIIETKPFNSNILEQIKLVSSFSWLDINKLNFIKDNIYDWFIEYRSKYLDEDRIDSIAKAVKKRIDYLITNYLKQ